MYTRQELANMFGVSWTTIQKYTKEGIIPKPVPARGRYARYGKAHVDAMSAIWGRNGLKDSTFTLAQWAEYQQIQAEG